MENAGLDRWTSVLIQEGCCVHLYSCNTDRCGDCSTFSGLSLLKGRPLPGVLILSVPCNGEIPFRNTKKHTVKRKVPGVFCLSSLSPLPFVFKIRLPQFMSGFQMGTEMQIVHPSPEMATEAGKRLHRSNLLLLSSLVKSVLAPQMEKLHPPALACWLLHSLLCCFQVCGL